MIINLVNNELKKIGLVKIILSLLFICLVVLIIILSVDSNSINESLYSIIPFIEIITCILFSSIFSNEVINGTFRMYLTKPISRKKIFLSKFLVILFYELICILMIILIYSILLNKIDINFIQNFFYYSIPMIIINQIILLLSNITNSTSLTLGFSIIIIIFSSTITNLLLYLKIHFVKYTFLPYIDLLYIKNNNYYNFPINIGIIILLVSSIIIYFINCYFFNKKDIKC